MQTLKRARICGQRLDIRPWVENRGGDNRRSGRRAPQRRAG
jgi:ATP-dependent RNA helicase DeaD